MIALTDLPRNVIWLADTNYRIDLENELVRSLAEADQLDGLVAADQARNMFGQYVRLLIHFG